MLNNMLSLLVSIKGNIEVYYLSGAISLTFHIGLKNCFHPNPTSKLFFAPDQDKIQGANLISLLVLDDKKFRLVLLWISQFQQNWTFEFYSKKVCSVVVIID